MKRWIKLLQVVADHKAGDLIQVEEATARAYITAGLAEEAQAPESQLTEAEREEIRQIGRDFAVDLAKEIRQGLAHGLRRPNVSGDGGVEFETIEGVDRDDRSFGGFMRDALVALGAVPSEDREKAVNRLSHPWSRGGYGVKRAMSSTTGASGGYTTPVIYESQVFKVAAEQGVILPGATTKPMGAKTVEWPALNQYTAPSAGQTAMYGGVSVYRKTESSQRTASNPTFAKVALTAIDLTAYCEIPRDLVADSTAVLDSMVPELMGGAIGWREDWEAFNGNGSGQFLGCLNAPATISLSRNTSSHIKYQDIFGMYVRLYSAGKKNAVWLVHPYTVSELMQIQDPSSRFIMIPWQPQGNDATPLGSASMSGFKMLGLPVLETEKAPVLGSTGDLMLIDRSAYYVGQRAGLEIGLSEHFKFDTDQIAIRAKIRNDGQPALKKAITLADGSNTVSFCVVLN